MKNNILVIGGTGKTGGRVVERLNNLGHHVRVGTRSNNPSFDWNDSSTWPGALAGMDKVYIVYYPDLAVPGALSAIEGLAEEAEKAGVQKLVLLSGKGETEAEKCEQAVINSGLRYTIVRASWFNQNFSESVFLEPILAGHVALPMAEAQIPFVDADDIADVATAALTDDQHDGQIYQLTGPQTLNFEEAISTIAKATGRTIAFQAISLEEYVKMMESMGLPADYIWLFGYLFKEVLGNPKNQVVTHDIEKVLGRKPTSFTEFAEKVAQKGVWNPTKEEEQQLAL